MSFDDERKKVFNGCFACGPDNPYGLRLKIQEGPDTAVCEWVARKEFEGFPDILHGGIISTICDDVMAHSLYYRNITIFTAHLEVDFRNTAYTGDTLVFESHLDWHREGSKAYHMAGTVKRGEDLIAEFKGVAVRSDIL